MKKNNFIYPVICLVTVFFLFVIPVSAFFSLEILGVNSAKSFWGIAYKVLADHGSLIAGIIAIFGVAWLINTQKTETANIIKSNENVIKSQSFEVKRASAIDHYLFLERQHKKIRKMFSSPKNDWNKYYEKITPEIVGPMQYLRYFLDDEDDGGVLYLDAIDSFYRYVLSSIKNIHYDFPVLISFIALYNLPDHDDTSLWCTMGDSVCSYYHPEKIHKERLEYSIDDTRGYILNYIDLVVMKNIKRIIEEKRIENQL